MSDTPKETSDLWETMSTMRAMRRLKPDPVPDELINKILQAGQWAPSAATPSAGGFWWSKTIRGQEKGAGLLQAAVRRERRAPLRHQRAAAGLRSGAVQLRQTRPSNT